MGHLFSPNHTAIRHPNILPATSSETLIVAGPASERCQSYDWKIQTQFRLHTPKTKDRLHQDPYTTTHVLPN